MRCRHLNGRFSHCPLTLLQQPPLKLDWGCKYSILQGKSGTVDDFQYGYYQNLKLTNYSEKVKNTIEYRGQSLFRDLGSLAVVIQPDDVLVPVIHLSVEVEVAHSVS